MICRSKVCFVKTSAGKIKQAIASVKVQPAGGLRTAVAETADAAPGNRLLSSNLRVRRQHSEQLEELRLRDIDIYRRSVWQDQNATCIDLFAGAGGLAAGFRSAGWAVLAANDCDESAGQTFRLNFPEASFFQGPISTLTADALLEECDLEPGELDCLIGGPPCQSFSYNNHQRSATDARARLFEDYLRLVEGLDPKTLIMENVPGILTIDDGRVIDAIKSRLGAMGYGSVVEIVSAEEFGTPQVRRRVFIGASRIGPAHELIPPPTSWSPTLRVVRQGQVIPRPEGASRRLVTVWQAIGDLPELRNGSGEHVAPRPNSRPSTVFQREARKWARILCNHVCHALTEVNLERIRHVPEGGNWRDIPRDLLPTGMQRARLSDHTKRYGRLSRTGMASTILTKCDPHWGAYVHPTQNRTISVREAARLQGFPDTFQFAGTHLSKQYHQVGNAVPIPVAKALGEAALSHVKKWERPWVSASIARRRATPNHVSRYKAA